MRRVALALFGTVAGLVALLSFKTHEISVARPPAAIGTTTGPDTGSATPNPATPPSSSSAAATSGTKTVTGDVADTRWGPVQVQITVKNGKLSGVTAVDYPNGNPRDQQINAYAIPALNQEALQAGSAKIDMISGATVTSEGYLNSLQSALDKAGI